jgi:hypothetical protein
MFSMKFNARLDMSYYGSLDPFKDTEVIAENLTGIHNAMVKCLFAVIRSCIHKGF